MRIDEILRLAPVMPVITIEDAAKAVPLARALVAGGLRVIEVTLRTAGALEAIAAIAKEVPECVLGVGTVLSERELDAASPGPLPLLPAIATASELMAAMERGFSAFKFFPAAYVGGTAALSALAGPFPAARFCPTGGIDVASAPAWLALSNVLCVGGSWVTPKDALAAGDFERIERLAKEAAALGKS
jgi:2-dehydro-3-deoxyphosphogluconate aldolase/(4S)-4-hydroxy-2-oxoglutarate aldolase